MLYLTYFGFSVITLFYFGLVNGTLSKSDKKSKKKENWLNEYDDLSLDVNSFLNTIETADIVKTSRKFKNKVLGYVTPWNNLGYDVARNYTNKFDIITPAWLQFTFKDNHALIKGEQDIDKKWIKALRDRNPNVKIVPRLIMENWPPGYLIHILQNPYSTSEHLDMIKSLLIKYNFDGIVLEMWLQLGMQSQPHCYQFLQHLYEDMRAMDKLMILAIPPPIYEKNRLGYISQSEVERLADSVDYFSLMTYDYSQKPGPNAPIKWMRQCIRLLAASKSDLRSKMLMGLNFYGYVYGGREKVKSVVRHELLNYLRNAVDSQMFWDKEHKEHYFQIKLKDKSERIIWYPTHQSIDLRLKLADKLGVGVSIWELGQGLLDFYSVF